MVALLSPTKLLCKPSMSGWAIFFLISKMVNPRTIKTMTKMMFTINENMILKHLPKLIINHVDAWGITLIIGIVALVVHPPFKLELIGIPIVLAFCYWLGFAVNDYFDAPFDGQDAKKGKGNFFVQVSL